MAVEVISVKDYEPKSSDIFFFDNNIWMLLFCAVGNYRQRSQKAYSAFLQSIQSSHSTIFTSSLVLSEFANASLRLDFRQWQETSGNITADFKQDYVGSERYKDAVETVRSGIKNIMKIAEKTPDDFNCLDLDHILDCLDKRDFNDNYYLTLAVSKNWKIVTDDSDYFSYDHPRLKIFTFNDKAFSN